MKCHASDQIYPKFVKQKSASPYFSELKFERKKTSVEDREHDLFVKSLNYHKLHYTEKDKFMIRDILEDARITTEILLNKIDICQNTSAELDKVKEEIK